MTLRVTAKLIKTAYMGNASNDIAYNDITYNDITYNDITYNDITYNDITYNVFCKSRKIFIS